jgi:hypothetical protein
MATVKFSGELREQIINTAKQKFAVQIQKVTNAHPANAAWGDVIYNEIMKDWLPTMLQLPASFFHERNSIVIVHIGSQHVGLEFPFTAAKLFPLALPDGAVAAKQNSYNNSFTLKAVPEFDLLVEEVRAWKARIAAATAQQQEFAASVSAVVHGYATLAPALKAWPPLWDLLAEHIKEKHKLIVEREKKEVVLGVDLDRATALASWTKIRGNDQ